MAIYHFSGSVISRSQGRSALACAAYRSASELYDVRYAKTHDYTKKVDVVYTEILLPQGAPEEYKNRETLWNHVEAAEKRKDAQLAREFNIALPRELTVEQAIVLTRAFVQKEFVEKGMIADIALHNDKNKAGETQPHVHVMLTLRAVTKEGFGPKVRTWNAKAHLLQWREAWAITVNHQLALHGYDIQIDHRSLKEQGIDLEPQYKIGASVAKERMARFEDHQRIAKENGERILENPALALDALTKQQSTFTHQDLARFIHRHTAHAEQFTQVYETVKAAPQIVTLGRDDKQRERFTTHAMLTLERDLFTHAKRLHAQEGHAVSQKAVTRVLKKTALTSEQQAALQYLTQPCDLKNLVGYAGTGKSYLLGAAKDVWEASGFRVRGVCLSGIAAQSLEQGAGIASRTVASFLYRLDNQSDTLTPRDMLVIDEAGMLGSRAMERLLRAVQENNVKVVLVGDPQQLQAIEAGAAFRALVEKYGHMELTDIQRQQVPWQRQATLQLAQGEVEAALRAYQAHNHLHECHTQADAKTQLMTHWNDARLAHPTHSQIVLAYTRQDVQDLNERARTLRQDNQELGPSHTFTLERGERQLAEGDRIYFLKRDDSLHVVNGTLGTLQHIHEKTKILTVQLDRDDLKHKERRIHVNTTHYPHLEHGYAATIHKAQGVTVDSAYLLTSPYLDAHATYVALSRHRKSCDVFVSREAFPNEQSLFQTVSRDRAKDVTLDYTQDFARLRGIEQEHKNQGLEHPKTQGLLTTHVLPLPPAEHASLEHQRNRHALKQRKDLMAFKAQFEARHPERARELKEAIRPQRERLALAMKEKFEALEDTLKTSPTSLKTRDALIKQAKEIAKKPDAMAYLKTEHENFLKRVERVVKEQGLSRQRGYRIER